MLSERLILFEYENILLGNNRNFQCAFKGTPKENKEEAGVVWRYAVSNLLKWTPEQALANLTEDIVYSLKLDKTFLALGFNKKNDYEVDYSFALEYAFPDRIKHNDKKRTIMHYERAAREGRFEYDPEAGRRLPKMFFLNETGLKRAAIVLNHVRGKYMGDMSIKEQYDFFADKEKAKEWLSGKYLNTPIEVLYDSPLEYFHYSIKVKERDNFIFYSHIVNDQFKMLEVIVKDKKKRPKKKK